MDNSSSSLNSSSSSILDILKEPKILEYLCCNYLTPKDVLNLGLTSKTIKALIDESSPVWDGFTVKLIGKDALDRPIIAPSSKEKFICLYRLEKPSNINIHDDERSESPSKKSSSVFQRQQILEMDMMAQDSPSKKGPTHEYGQELGEEYYSSLPNVPPPPVTSSSVVSDSGNNEVDQPNLPGNTKPSLLTAYIENGLNNNYQDGDDDDDDDDDEYEKDVSPQPDISPAKSSLFSRMSDSQVINSESNSATGSFVKPYAKPSFNRNPSNPISIGSMGYSSSLSYSPSSSKALDIYESSSFSSSPSASAVSYKSHIKSVDSSSNNSSSSQHCSPQFSAFPVVPPELPSTSERVESPSYQGSALVVIEMDKERDEQEKRKRRTMSLKDADQNRGIEMTKRSFTAKQEAPSPTPSGTEKSKRGSTNLSSKSVVPDDKNSAGTPVSSNFDFKALLERPDFKQIKTTIDAFVKGFEKKTKGNIDEEVKNTKLLITATENSMKHHPIWAKLPHSHTIVAKEEMQRYIYSRLYNVIFVKKEYEEKDQEIKKHIEELRPLLTPEFLELKEMYYKNDELKAAIAELDHFESDAFITPREKITVIFNSCKILNYILNSEGSAAGADDFLPLFIYVISQSKLTKLYSNKEYIGRYIDSSEKFAESYYYYTHMVSAINYLSNLTLQKIKDVTKEREKKSLQEKMAREVELEKLYPERTFLRSETELVTMAKSIKSIIEKGGLTNSDDKKLVASFIEMSERFMPHFHHIQSWGLERYIRNDIIFLPPGETSITALFIDFGYIWAALSNGRVAIFSTETYQIVRTLDLFDPKKAKSIVSIIQPDDIRNGISNDINHSDICVVAETGTVVIVDKLFYRSKRKILLFPPDVEQKVTCVKVFSRKIWISAVSLDPQSVSSSISIIDPKSLRLICCFSVPGEHVSEIVPVSGPTSEATGKNHVWCATKSGRLILVNSNDGVVAEVACHSPHKKSISNLFVSQGRLWYLSDGKVCVVPTDDSALVPKVLYPAPENAGIDDLEKNPAKLTCLAPLCVSWESGISVTDFVVGVGSFGVTRLWNAKDLGTEAVLKNENIRLKTPKALTTFYNTHSFSTLWAVANEEKRSLHVYTLKKEDDVQTN